MRQPCSATEERGMHKTAQRWRRRRRRRRRRRDYNHSTGQCYIGHSVDALSGHVQYRIVRWCILHMCTNVSVTPLLKDISSQSLVAITTTVADIIQMLKCTHYRPTWTLMSSMNIFCVHTPHTFTYISIQLHMICLLVGT